MLLNELLLRGQLSELQGPGQQSWSLKVSISPSAMCLGSVCSQHLALDSFLLGSYHSLRSWLPEKSLRARPRRAHYLTGLPWKAEELRWANLSIRIHGCSGSPPPQDLGELGTNHITSESLLSPLAQSRYLNI